MSAPPPVAHGATALPVAVAQRVPMAVAQPMSVPMASAVVIGDDAVAKLEQLKTMLDRGLITEKDFNVKKAEILASM